MPKHKETAGGTTLDNSRIARICRRPGHQMISALVLICLISVIPDLQDCTPENARMTLRLTTEFASPVTCFLQGQALLAATSIGQDLTSDDRIKIVCKRSETVSASVRRLIVK